MKTTKTTRFGSINVLPSEVITFPDSILGFTEKTFAIVNPDDMTGIQWLQSLENSGLAFAMVKASDIFPGYKASLGFTSDEEVYLLLTIPNDITKMTMNTKAPIVINQSTLEGKQIVLNNCRDLNVNRPAYQDIKELILKGKSA
jgi:flagellar assembly factor FliW